MCTCVGDWPNLACKILTHCYTYSGTSRETTAAFLNEVASVHIMIDGSIVAFLHLVGGMLGDVDCIATSTYVCELH